MKQIAWEICGTIYRSGGKIAASEIQKTVAMEGDGKQ